MVRAKSHQHPVSASAPNGKLCPVNHRFHPRSRQRRTGDRSDRSPRGATTGHRGRLHEWSAWTSLLQQNEESWAPVWFRAPTICKARAPVVGATGLRWCPVAASEMSLVGTTVISMDHGYGESDFQRWCAEEPKSPQRTPFQRDRARVVHSSALRRLGAKTQVVGPATDDFVRTRLTHSLEVAQVGRELGKALGCDPDVVDTACLAHDLGHPPFGHNGERALADLTGHMGSFEGNAQTLRLLTRLEPKIFDQESGEPRGLNLTRASLDAVTKYPWGHGEGPISPITDEVTAKFGVYEDDREVFTWLRAGAPPGVLCLEAQVMDLADDISYCVHDVEDAIVAGWLELSELRDPEVRDRITSVVKEWHGAPVDRNGLDEAIPRLQALPWWVEGFDGSRRALARLKDLTSQLIGRFCLAAEKLTRSRYGAGQLTRYAASLEVPVETLAEIAILKGIAAEFVMKNQSRQAEYGRQREIVTELVTTLAQREGAGLEAPFAADYKNAANDQEKLRVIVDQIAALTDVSALQWHAQLTGSNPSLRI